MISKLDRLKEWLLSTGGLAVAHSGGVDSTFLLSVAAKVLGDRVMAVTVVSPTFPAQDLEDARREAVRLGVRRVEVVEDLLANVLAIARLAYKEGQEGKG